MRRERVLGCRPGRLRPSDGCGAPMGKREADRLLDDAIDSKGDLYSPVCKLHARRDVVPVTEVLNAYHSGKGSRDYE